MSQGISRDVAGFFQGTVVRIRFGPFTLDLDTRQLTRAGREIHLAPKAFELLTFIVLERPKVLSKADLQERLWPGTFVAEANLSNLVAEIRAALGDAARTPRFIRTVHGFGYAFCGDATALRAPREAATARISCWLESDGRRFPLLSGEYVIGRDADVEVRLDSSSVSRRHARIIVTAERAVIEDCGSKNGTFRGNERVTSPIPLANGDTIRVGSLLVFFHASAVFGTTDTQAEPTA